MTSSRRFSVLPALGRAVCVVVSVACAVLGTSARAQTQAGETTRRAAPATGSSCQSIPRDTLSAAANLSAELQGRIPGLQIFSTTARGGAGTLIRLRGNGSVGGSNEPLIYVDDIRIASVRISNVTRSVTAQSMLNALDFLDLADIAQVDVLRGPAATTLYGMDAANGVIRIYTKRGQKKGGYQAESRVRCPI